MLLPPGVVPPGIPSPGIPSPGIPSPGIPWPGTPSPATMPPGMVSPRVPGGVVRVPGGVVLPWSELEASRAVLPSSGPPLPSRPLAWSGLVALPGPVGAGSGSGACSRMRWALVPLIPKEETPARRGRPCSGQGRGLVRRLTCPVVQSTCGVGWSTCRVWGRWAWRRAMTILITPAAPAAAWAWPMFDLMDPRCSGRSWGRSWP